MKQKTVLLIVLALSALLATYVVLDDNKMTPQTLKKHLAPACVFVPNSKTLGRQFSTD